MAGTLHLGLTVAGFLMAGTLHLGLTVAGFLMTGTLHLGLTVAGFLMAGTEIKSSILSNLRAGKQGIFITPFSNG